MPSLRGDIEESVFDMPSELDSVLPRCAELVELVCSLPGAPVPDWCELAAKALHNLSPQGLVAISVATQAAHSTTTEVESVGVDCTSADRAQVAVRRLQRPVAHTSPVKFGLQPLSQHLHLRELATAEFAQASLWTATRSLQSSPDIWLSMSVILPHAANLQTDATLCDTLLSILATRAKHALPSASGAIRWLTRREAEVMDQLVLGYSIREIADILKLSHHTVQDHVKHLHTKLEANNRGEVVARALGKRGPARNV